MTDMEQSNSLGHTAIYLDTDEGREYLKVDRKGEFYFELGSIGAMSFKEPVAEQFALSLMKEMNISGLKTIDLNGETKSEKPEEKGKEPDK